MNRSHLRDDAGNPFDVVMNRTQWFQTSPSINTSLASIWSEPLNISGVINSSGVPKDSIFVKFESFQPVDICGIILQMLVFIGGSLFNGLVFWVWSCEDRLAFEVIQLHVAGSSLLDGLLGSITILLSRVCFLLQDPLNGLRMFCASILIAYCNVIMEDGAAILQSILRARQVGNSKST